MIELLYRTAMLICTIGAFAGVSQFIFADVHDYVLSGFSGLVVALIVWAGFSQAIERYYGKLDAPCVRYYPADFRDVFAALKDLITDLPVLDPQSGIPRDWRLRFDQHKGTLVAVVEFQEDYTVGRQMMFRHRWAYERSLRLLITCTAIEGGTKVQIEWSVASKGNRFVVNRMIADMTAAIDSRLRALPVSA